MDGRGNSATSLLSAANGTFPLIDHGDYFALLAARLAGATEAVRPVVPSRFEAQAGTDSRLAPPSEATSHLPASQMTIGSLNGTKKFLRPPFRLRNRAIAAADRGASPEHLNPAT
jgi:hypothetical protein